MESPTPTQGKSENGCGSQEIHDGSRLRVPSCRGREWERLVYCLKRGCDNSEPVGRFRTRVLEDVRCLRNIRNRGRGTRERERLWFLSALKVTGNASPCKGDCFQKSFQSLWSSRIQFIGTSCSQMSQEGAVWGSRDAELWNRVGRKSKAMCS